MVFLMTNRNLLDADPRMSREDAAETLRVSVSTIDRYLRDGILPKSKLGKRLVRIDRAAVEALLSGEKAVS